MKRCRGVPALLAAAACAALAPAALADGAPRIAYVRDVGGNRDIYVLTVDGSAPKRLTFSDQADDVPAFSPDGSKIAYEHDSVVWVMNADGSGAHEVGWPYTHRPNWSRDGRRLVFNGIPPGQQGSAIFTSDPDGRNVEQVSTNADGDPSMYGSFSPDGSRIAFQRGGHIWVVNSDATNEHAVSASLDGEVPAWSPTGKEIAFQEWEPLPPYDPVGTGFDIYAVHPDGTGLRNITAFTGSDTAPAWSPDGRRIAFAAERDGNGELYVTNADGTGATRLTHDDGGPEMPFDGGPSWDPSSRSGATALPQSASPGALPGRRHGRLVLRCAKRQRVRHGAIVLRVRARADSVVVVHGRLFVGERFVARRAARTVHLRLRRSARARVEHARVPVAARVRVTVWGPDGVRASTSAVSALR